MKTPRIYRTDAVVLKGYDYGEADRILTLITPNEGKLRVIAKGVRRTKSRKAGHLDLFTRSNLLIARGRQLDVVTQAEALETFRPMREDVARSSCCHYVAELIERFCPEQSANYPLYVLTVSAFRRLSLAGDLDLVLRGFEIQLLAATGYRPQLHTCLQCNAVIQPEVNHFSARMGGVLCPTCGPVDRAASRISVPALKLLRNLQTNEDAVLKVSGLDPDVQREVERRLQEYITFRLEDRPRSMRFLDRLRAEDGLMPAAADIHVRVHSDWNVAAPPPTDHHV